MGQMTLHGSTVNYAVTIKGQNIRVWHGMDKYVTFCGTLDELIEQHPAIVQELLDAGLIVLTKE